MQRHTHIHTRWVQGATECRAVGVRLQERGHPKRRLLLSLFNCWLGRLFEGPFNCHSDGALKTRRLFSPFLLISPLMTPIKTPPLPSTQLCFAFFSPLPVALSLWLLVFFFTLSPHFVTRGFTYSCPSLSPSQCIPHSGLPIKAKTGDSSYAVTLWGK